MGTYVKEMKVKLFDIASGKQISLIHEADARELGIFALDRLEIINSKNKKCTVTVVDTTTTMVKKGEIGIYTDVKKHLLAKGGQKLDVKAVAQPESVEFIKKKMRGQILNEEEINAIVKDMGDNKISEIEAAAFTSAIFIHGYSLSEIIAMTKALKNDGSELRISKKPVVDKHSIGGTNGRATMIIVPILAAAGLYVPKTSSRSITSPAGTADAMEVLANVSLDSKKIKQIVEKIGGVIVWGGSLDLAPVDDKIIKIEHPLGLDPDGQIIASVMAKKASVGAEFLVIDLPVGPDVKITTRERAKDMARKFIKVGKSVGIKVEVAITDGTKPSGKAFGPALEAKYVLQILEGDIFDNLAEKSCELAGLLLELSGKAKKGKGKKIATEILESGKALKKMKEIIKAQGGKIFKSDEIKYAKYKAVIRANCEGEISKINIKKCIKAARLAGAPADAKAGLMLHVNEEDTLKKDDIVFVIYATNPRKLELAKKYVQKDSPIESEGIVLEIVV